jgi:hypothetical protein
MKTLIKISIFLGLSIIIYITSCSPDDNDEIIAPGSEPSKEINLGMEAKINDSIWKATNYSAVITDKRIVIKGYSNSLGNINIVLLDTALNTYYLNPTSGHYATYTCDSNFIDLYSTFSSVKVGGLVILSEINRDSSFVSGNFNFAVYNKKEDKTYTISQGSFIRVKYTVENSISTGIVAKTNDSVAWKDAGREGIIDDRFISVTGVTSDSGLISFSIFNNIPGTYSLNNNSIHFGQYRHNKSDSALYSTKIGISSTGMVVISEITKDSLASGSFVFTACKKNGSIANITEGIFKEIKLR